MSRAQPVSRRTLLRVGASLTGVLAVAGGAWGTVKQLWPERAGALGLRPGQILGRWRVKSVSPVRAGTICVGMKNEQGQDFRVDVVRRGAGPKPLAETDGFGLFLVNNGTGATPSHEDHGCGVLMLGRYLHEQERGGLVPPADLLTFEQRRRAFPAREAGRRRA